MPVTVPYWRHFCGNQPYQLWSVLGSCQTLLLDWPCQLLSNTGSCWRCSCWSCQLGPDFDACPHNGCQQCNCYILTAGLVCSSLPHGSVVLMAHVFLPIFLTCLTTVYLTGMVCTEWALPMYYMGTFYVLSGCSSWDYTSLVCWITDIADWSTVQLKPFNLWLNS